MEVRRLLVGFSEQSKTRLTFLSPRSSKPLARTPTLITPFRALGNEQSTTATIRLEIPLSQRVFLPQESHVTTSVFLWTRESNLGVSGSQHNLTPPPSPGAPTALCQLFCLFIVTTHTYSEIQSISDPAHTCGTRRGHSSAALHTCEQHHLNVPWVVIAMQLEVGTK